MPALVEDGRAKVNLTLRVIGRRADGYHDLESLVAFADCADRLTLDARARTDARRPPGRWREACGETADNLVLKAARLLGRARARPQARRIQRSTRCCRSRPASAAARPMPRRRCGCWRGSTVLSLDDSRLLRGRAADRRRRAGVPRLARLRHDRRRREPVAACACRKCPACWSIRAFRSRPRTCSRRSVCATANSWSAPPTCSRRRPGRNRARRSKTGSKRCRASCQRPRSARPRASSP